jgi:hypothetical protein
MRLPDEITEEIDDRVSSYWIAGESLLLQVSSYARQGGDQAGAIRRLQDRIAKSNAPWQIWAKRLHHDNRVDEAVGETKYESGLSWIHVYLVWPHLSVYATISGPDELVRVENNWSYEAIKSICLTLG